MLILVDFDRTLFDTDALIAWGEENGRKRPYARFARGEIRHWVFDDTWEVIPQLRKHHTPVLFTFDTELAWQRAKVVATEMVPLFDGFEVIDLPKGDAWLQIRDQYDLEDGVVFVDDSLRQIESMQEKAPEVRSILMDRFNEYPDFEGERITSLTELESLLTT